MHRSGDYINDASSAFDGEGGVGWFPCCLFDVMIYVLNSNILE